MNKCVFFDKDGTLNSVIRRHNKITGPWNMSEFSPFSDVKDSLSILKNEGYYLLIVSNQPDYYDGYLRLNDLNAMDQWYRAHGIDDSFYAFDRYSKYYKPMNGMIEFFIQKYHIDRTKSFMVGDSWKDMAAGRDSSLHTIQIGITAVEENDMLKYKPNYQCNYLTEVTNYILERKEIHNV